MGSLLVIFPRERLQSEWRTDVPHAPSGSEGPSAFALVYRYGAILVPKQALTTVALSPVAARSIIAAANAQPWMSVEIPKPFLGER
jgi:hypothetical protein